MLLISSDIRFVDTCCHSGEWYLGSFQWMKYLCAYWYLLSNVWDVSLYEIVYDDKESAIGCEYIVIGRLYGYWYAIYLIHVLLDGHSNAYASTNVGLLQPLAIEMHTLLQMLGYCNLYGEETSTQYSVVSLMLFSDLKDIFILFLLVSYSVQTVVSIWFPFDGW